MIITVTLNPALDKTLEVPGFRVGAHARARVLGVEPAGKGVNVAVGLARLGSPVVAAGFVGTAEAGPFADSLRAHGVEPALCAVQGATRVNTTVLDPEERTATHLREPGFPVGPGDVAELGVRLECLLREHARASVAFCGSLPPGMTPEDLTALLRRCAALGGRAVVDTSGDWLRAAVETGLVETLKPNLSELGECLNRIVTENAVPPAARELLDRVRVVLVTLGEEGALVVSRDGVLSGRCPLRADEQGNSVGCGDAFLAGWLHGDDLNLSPGECLDLALAAGAACARTRATVGYTRADVEELMPRCIKAAS